MSTISERIAQVVKASKLTKSKAAEMLGISPSYISMLCSGDKTPSERTIRDIARAFDIDEHWLRTGEGDMVVPRTRDEEIAEALAGAISGESTARDRLIRALARLPDDAFPAIERFILAAAEKLQEEQT